MGSPRQPLGASSNASAAANTPSHAAREAALTGANLAFIKSLPPHEAKKFLDKHSPPKLQHVPSRDVLSVPKRSTQKPTVPSSTHKPSLPSSTRTASLTAARASPSVGAKSPSTPDDASVRSASQASVRAAENVYSPSLILPKRVSPDKLDRRPIAPTTSLVELFERKGSPPAIKSPKPTRKPAILRNQSLEPITTRLENKRPDSSSGESFTSARDHLSPDQPFKPVLPAPRRSAKRADSRLNVPIEPSIRVQPPSRSISLNKPASPLPRSTPSPAPSQLAPAAKPLPASRNNSPNSLTQPAQQSITAAYHQLHPRRLTPLKSGDSLANAIVASSLASSRAPSPAKLPPPVSAPTRRTSHGSFFSRTPSPPKKGMRHTMRKASDSESEEDEDPYSKHKKKRFVRKHPNKHHEGDRKRWRDAVTQRERKRYEGVWAANKGICVEYTAAELNLLAAHPESKESEKIRSSVADQVADLVARDIWMRSRLPGHELEQVWDLVDNQQVGRLHRDEFVVGSWLIDQRLKGRKLPVKVTDSVWNSVRLLSGIKLRKGWW